MLDEPPGLQTVHCLVWHTPTNETSQAAVKRENEQSFRQMHEDKGLFDVVMGPRAYTKDDGKIKPYDLDKVPRKRVIIDTRTPVKADEMLSEQKPDLE